jgi:hypothetical protein
MTKDEFKTEFFELLTTLSPVLATPKGLTMNLTPLTDKLWELYNISRKEETHGKINS